MAGLRIPQSSVMISSSLYTDLLSELMAGHSPEFGGSSNHTEDSDRTVVYDEDAVGGAGLAALTNVAMTSPPSSPTTPPSSQLRRRGAFDIEELVAAASTAARATAWFAPDASSALAALAAAASAIAGTESAEARAEDIPSTNGASAATDAVASMESRQCVLESTGMEVAKDASDSVDVAGSPPLHFGEIALCIICTEEMLHPVSQTIADIETAVEGVCGEFYVWGTGDVLCLDENIRESGDALDI